MLNLPISRREQNARLNEHRAAQIEKQRQEQRAQSAGAASPDVTAAAERHRQSVAVHKRAQLVWTDAYRIDPRGERTRQARAELDAAEQAMTDAEAALEFARRRAATERAAFEAANLADLEAERATKRAELDGLLIKLAQKGLEADLQPLLPDLVQAFDLLVGVARRADVIVEAREATRAKAAQLARECGAQFELFGETYNLLFMGSRNETHAATRRVFARILGAHCDVFGLPRQIACLLETAPPVPSQG